MKVLQQTFGYPKRIITDRGTAFTSNEFKDYCKEEEISHFLITTDVPRGNGQVERIHQIITSVLTKLSRDNPMHWYKYISDVQRFINATHQRSINTTPFEIMIGIKMRNKENIRLKELLEEEKRLAVENERENLRAMAKEQLFKIQEENKKSFDKRRKQARTYQVGDLVAIRRTQLGTGLKIHSKFLGPYHVSIVNPNDRYVLERAEPGEGPLKTTSSADLMKPRANTNYPSQEDDDMHSYEDDDIPFDDDNDSEDSVDFDEPNPNPSEADEEQEWPTYGTPLQRT